LYIAENGLSLKLTYMTKWILTVICLCWSVGLTLAQTSNPDYDAKLAEKLGADAYGMKSYVLVMLKTGPVEVEDKAVRDSLFRGHLDNIGRLVDLGKLVVAGPLGKNEQHYRGIFILNVTNLDEARELLESDPVIREKVLEADLFLWYGSAALPEYLKVHRLIEKNKH
jgi:uncharacterized protein YciI